MIEQLFSELDRRGLHAEIVGGALKITPSSRIDSDLRQALRENMLAVLAHLTAKGDQGIEWRLARFLEQLKLIHPPATLPLLIALDAGPRRKEDCLSCSELRKDGDGFLCARCVTAKRLALDMWFARLVKGENPS